MHTAAEQVVHVGTLMLVGNHHSLLNTLPLSNLLRGETTMLQGRVYSGTEAGKRRCLESTGIHICFVTHLLCEYLMCMKINPMQN